MEATLLQIVVIALGVVLGLAIDRLLKRVF